ncbi:MAG: hypothetical protein BGO98_07955 [Myxococcales bacterium 68-20]|nr:hypothetical protein [Myxococcales bacterium]OJY28770.1 MAG: hypothetical protein BGO98_07955 [Myxococcales bacterium 68-20]
MSIDPLEPPRMGEHGSDEARDLLRAIREDAPGPASMERMAKRLAAAGALSTLPPEPQIQSRVGPRFATYTRGLVALAVAGGLAVSWQVTQRPYSKTATGGPIAALSGENGATDTAAPPVEPAAARPLDDPETPTLSVDQLPSAAAPTTTVAAPAGGNVRAPRAPSSIEPAGPTPASELELLQRARATLALDPARALSITSEQASAYPSGEFIQEREVIAVEALSRLGRRDEALRRARALVSQFPRTPYGDRLEIAIGHAL